MSTERADSTDEELMRRLVAGQEAALDELMRRWERPLKSFLFRMVGNTAEAEDLAQDVFVRVFTQAGRFRPGARFSTWLFTIAANQARNRLRWWRRRPLQSLEAWQESGVEVADESADSAHPALRQEQGQRVADLRAAIARLPNDDRFALVLFEYEQKSMAEVALILGCTAKAVENRLYRARRRLAEWLKARPV